MLFHSWNFLFVFLPVTLAVTWLVPARRNTLRVIWLTVASVAFYAYWSVAFVPLLLASVAINYVLASAIAAARRTRRGRYLLFAGLTVNILALGAFKYANFVLGLLSRSGIADLPQHEIALPLGISFFTFTQIAFLVDNFREPRERVGFFDYTLFVVFFPHLIAGPILRRDEILPQLAARRLRCDATDLAAGWTIFLIGAYKKVFLADSVAVYADAAYGAAAAGANLSWFEAWLGTLAFGLQIYFDFSGYSEMAIGLARMWGVRFPANFDSPYRASSIIDFWRRWHMTLTRFFHDYVYVALGGHRRGTLRQFGNILLVTALSGLWHGAAGHFIVWGCIHGALLVVARAWRTHVRLPEAVATSALYRASCTAATFFAVSVAWAFFRAPSVPVATRIVFSMLGGHGLTAPAEIGDASGLMRGFFETFGVTMVASSMAVGSWSLATLVVGACLALVWWSPNALQVLASVQPTIDAREQPAAPRLPIGAALGFALGACFVFLIRVLRAGEPNPFIYFEF